MPKELLAFAVSVGVKGGIKEVCKVYKLKDEVKVAEVFAKGMSKGFDQVSKLMS